MDVKVLQYIMGHSRISVTMEVYDHILPQIYLKFTSNSKKACEKMRQFETILKSRDLKSPEK